MLSIAFNQKNSISFIFDKGCAELKNTVIDIIIKSIDQPIIFVFEFYGIQADEIIDDFKSTQHILVIDKKHVIFKDLPRLYITSKYSEDINVFKYNIGSYNEGSMYLYIINENIDESFLSELEINRMREIIAKKTFLSIEVGSDGESFEVYCRSSSKLMQICNLINNFMFNDDNC